MPAIGLDRDRPIGWDIRCPAGVAPVGGASVIGFRDCGAAGLDIRVVAIPAVTVAIEFGGTGLTVDSAAGRQAFTGFVSVFPRGTTRVRSRRVECIEVRLSPLRAYSLLGVAPSDLGCAVVDWEDLWGTAGAVAA